MSLYDICSKCYPVVFLYYAPFFSESFMFIVSLHQLLLYSVYGREIWPIGYCGCFVLAGIYELPPIKEMHQISH